MNYQEMLEWCLALCIITPEEYSQAVMLLKEKEEIK